MTEENVELLRAAAATRWVVAEAHTDVVDRDSTFLTEAIADEVLLCSVHLAEGGVEGKDVGVEVELALDRDVDLAPRWCEELPCCSAGLDNGLRVRDG